MGFIFNRGNNDVDTSIGLSNIKLQAIYNELTQKLESGEEVALTPATIAQLQEVEATISNLPADYPDSAALSALISSYALLEEILGQVGDNGTLLQDLSSSLNGTLSVFVENPTTTVTVTGEVEVKNDTGNPLPAAVTNFPVSQAVTGPLTDTQLRATPVPVSGTVSVTDGSGPLSVDGTVGVSNLPATYPDPNTTTQLVGANSHLATVELQLDDIDTSVEDSNILLTAIEDVVDGLEGLVTLTNTKLDGIDTVLGTATLAPPAGTKILGWLQNIYTKLNGTLAVSGPLTNTELRAAVVPVTDRGATGTATRTATSTVNVTLAASNANRKQIIIANESQTALYVKYGNTASTTSYAFRLAGLATLIEDKYTGRIDAILNTGTSVAQVTEIT